MKKFLVWFSILFWGMQAIASDLEFEILEAQPREAYYFSTPGKLILLHGEVMTPIIDNSKRKYFSIVRQNGQWRLTQLNEPSYRIGMAWAQGIEATSSLNGDTLNFSFEGNEFQVSGLFNQPSLTTLKDAYVYTDVLRFTPGVKTSSPTPLQDRLYEVVPGLKYYVETAGSLILLHGDIVTPIMDGSKKRFFMLEFKDGRWILTSVTEAFFKAGVAGVDNISTIPPSGGKDMSLSFIGNRLVIKNYLGNFSLTTLQTSVMEGMPLTRPTISFQGTPSTDLIAGKLIGEFNVGQAGEASYKIKLDIPLGVNSLTPSLNLKYNSNGAYGILGWGGSLEYENRVSRCSKNIYENGEGGQGLVRLDQRDRLCWGGKPLRLVGTLRGQVVTDKEYWGQNKEYYQENTPGFLVRAMGWRDDAPDYFTSIDKGRVTTYYGRGSAKEIRLRGQSLATISWAVDSKQDAYQNLISYDYQTDIQHGNQYLSSISYGGKSSAEHIYKINLDYIKNSRINSGYLAGTRFTYDKLLKGVSVSINGVTQAIYHLGYETQESLSPQSYLRFVQKCFRNGDCYPATLFNWKRDDEPLSISREDTLELNYESFSIADIKGDGKAKIIYISGGDFKYYAYESKSNKVVAAYGEIDKFVTFPSINKENRGQFEIPSTYISNFSDVNGDGVDDIITTSNNGGINTFSEFGRIWSGKYSNTNNIYVFDTDGDGRDELVVNGVPVKIDSFDNHPITGRGHAIPFADLDGDGVMDWLYRTLSYDVVIGGGKNDHVIHHSGTEQLHSSFPPLVRRDNLVTNSIYSFDNEWRSFIDLNGDGYPEMFKGSKALLTKKFDGADRKTGNYIKTLSIFDNTGIDIKDVSNTVSVDALAYLVIDLNHDGVKDVLLQTGKRLWTVFISRNVAGSNTVSLHKWGSFSATEDLRAADLDGDGQVELIGGDEGKRIIIYRITAPYSQLNRLGSITEGLGKKISIDYTPLTDTQVLDYVTSSQYADLFPNVSRLPNGRYPNAFPYIIPMGGTYVVKNYSETGKDGTLVQYRLKYGGPLAHQQGIGWLGFERVTVEGILDKSRRVFEYHQLPPMTGLLKRSDYSIDGKFISRLDNTWSTHVYSLGNNAYEPIVVLAGSEESRFDLSNGELLSLTTKTMQYDNAGNLLKQQETTGTRSIYHTFTYNEPRYGTRSSEQISYNTSGNPSWLNERIDYLTFDTQGSPTRSKQVAYVGVTMPTSSTGLSHEYEYDRYGHLIRLTQSDGASTRTTRWRFSKNGRLLVSMTNALGQIQSYRYNGGEPDAVQGQVVRITEIDPNGIASEQRFDLDGRLIGERKPGQSERRMTYTLCGDCPPSASFSVITETSGVPTQIGYFNQDNLLVETRIDGFDGLPVIATNIYDWQGNLTIQTKPEFGGSAYAIRYRYDALSRMIKREDETSLGTVMTSWEYDGLKQTITNSKGQTLLEEYDPNGWLVATTDALGGRTQFTYDAKGQLLRAIPNGVVNAGTVQEFDAWGRRTALKDTSKGIWRYSYNAFGELISQQDGKGKQTRFQYDALGRLISRQHPDALDCFNYDAATYGIGQLVRQTRFTGGTCDQSLVSSRYTRSYRYDDKGRKVAEEAVFKGQTLAMGYTYDGYGRLSQTRYPSADNRPLTVRQRYNPAGYPSELVDETTQQLIQRTDRMDATGKVVQETLGNQVVINNAYVAGTDLLSESSSTLGGRDLLAQRYEYDMGFNLVERSHQISFSPLSRTRIEERFEYDDLNRLTRVAQSHQGKWQQSERYTYDPLGNLLNSLKLGGYSYDPAHPYRLVQVGSKRLGYDTNGNVINDGDRTLTYEGDDRPTSISKGQESTHFAYGSDDVRYWRQDVRVADGKRTTLDTFYLDKVYEKQVRTGDKGGLTEHRYYVGNLILVRRSNQTEDRLYQHLDHQGSVILVSDQKGDVAQAFAYSGFGEQRRLLLASRFAALLTPTRRGYTGHEMIEDLGIIHMNGRLYDPAMGRFLQADPYVPEPSDGQSFNRYAYVRNNPLNAVDPSGFWDIGTCAADIRNDNSGRDYSGKNSPESICGGNSPSYAARQQDGTWKAEPKDGTNKPKEVERGFWSTTAHAILAGLGAVPVLGAGPDLLDAGLYAIEGDAPGTALAMASAGASFTPGVDQAVAGLKMAHLGLIGAKATETTATAAKIANQTAAETAGVAKSIGRTGKQKKLRDLANDNKLGSADRGWIKQEINSIERGQRKSIRNPPGKDLAHERGREASKGYGYEHSNLQDRDLHRLQHKYDNFGRDNKERPLE
ncbi:RHS repeat-associated core domain-containing protein [Aeromonas salmonicida]|uniref:RHS repeat-associated core domain-containing protein n=1 Tax=Aeromonas salmonicida TaxID=645 RepID=UPI00145B210C|nr:RHS repeat-associated core domain-containing protein [Aeromonas salmonicida]